MERKFFRITEVVEMCGVDRQFVARLEQEQVIEPVVRSDAKYYPREQVERVRIARLLMHDMGVNLEGAEVALHMREQMIAMQRQFKEILRKLAQSRKR
jgi:DNA-binding transcriptional MerR regulator